ncbi:MAG: L-methionine (R)-S-oxide reductase [Planctomycetota bacterium]|jgi:L-methionine (R)-S-oxide reductase
MPESTTSRDKKLRARYERLAEQLEELYRKVQDPQSRMASAAALLHHKMPHFFWTGFYRHVDGDLLVGPYQGPIACMLLERDKGVCWASVNSGEGMLVPDVEAFPGHIACDSRSKSEVVIPLRDSTGQIVAVLDVDSDQPAAFNDVDLKGLTRIVALIHS